MDAERKSNITCELYTDSRLWHWLHILLIWVDTKRLKKFWDGDLEGFGSLDMEWPKGNEVNFWPADRLKSLLPVDSITLGVSSQACPKYPKQKVYIIFAIPQGKR